MKSSPRPRAVELLGGLALLLPGEQKRTIDIDDTYVEMGYPLFGSVVRAVGDVNLDGTTDFVIADPAYEEMSSFQCMFWIISGADSTVLVTKELDEALTEGTGTSDLNGDGIPDLVFSGPKAARKELTAFSGKTGNSLWSTIVDASEIQIAQGADSKWDLNDDHISDVLVSLRSKRDKQWHVAVHSGKNGTLLPFAHVFPAESHARVEWIEDADDDGVPDVCVGSLGSGGTGLRFTILSGRDAKVLKEWQGGMTDRIEGLGLCLSPAHGHKGSIVLYAGVADHIAAYRAMTGQQLWCVDEKSETLDGPWMGILGDIDSDGVDELIVGWPWSNSGWGRVEVLSGRTGRQIWELKGPSELAQFGTSPVTITDRDGDSIPDLLIGCDNGILREAGRVQLVSGGTGASLSGLFRQGKAVLERQGDMEWE